MPSSVVPSHGGKPLISVLTQTFLRGPNLHADQSALVVTLRGDQAFATLSQKATAGLGGLAGCENLAGGEAVLRLLESARDGLGKAAKGWDLALAVAERAQAEYLLVPACGRLLDRAGSDFTFLVPADHPKVGLSALELGISLVLALPAAANPATHKRAIARHQQFVRTALVHSPDMLTLAIARCALANDIPVYPIDIRPPMVQLGQGRYARLAMETVLEPQSRHADMLTRDKWATQARLRGLGLPVLPARLVADADGAVAAARQLGGPVAVKPVNGAKGIGISLRLTNEAQVRRAHAIAAKRDRRVMIEAYAEGSDHRATVVDGRMIAAARRVPASVTGDGKRSVRQLIGALNGDPRRGSLPYEKLMERVQVDARLETLLAQQGLTLEAIPPAGAQVKVSLAANISQGGSAVDVTDQVHPDNRAAIEAAARAFHALVAGIDFLSPDIGRSWRSGVGWILEVNTSPGLRPHWIADPERDVVTPILRVAFPEGAPSRVPSAGITGSMGKTTTCQMLAQIARAAGRHPALSTTQGTWSGTMQFRASDWAGGGAAAGLLGDTAVDVTIAELARGGLLKKGMTLDGVDVVAVLNVSDNHIGIDGIESREDLARIKSIPVRAAREWVFLDADDPLVLGMRDVAKPGVRIGLVSPDPGSAALAAHRAEGGCTATLEGVEDKTRAVVREGENVLLELPLAGIPASENLPRAALATNAMFVGAIALKLGFTPAEIVGGLAGFTSDLGQNPGRHNRVEGFPFELLLTWVDGAPPLRELVARLDEEDRPAGKRHLYLTIPGNRSDEWTIEMGRIAARHFDRYWCSDMVDRRGRPPGELPELMAQGLREAGVDPQAITCLAGPERALGPLLARIEPGAHVTLIIYETANGLREIEEARPK
jgi:cyanophycin synthetase